MSSRKAMRVLENIATLKYATKKNLTNITSVDAKTKTGIIYEADRLIRILEDEKLVIKIPNKYGKKGNKATTFYQLTKQGRDSLPDDYKLTPVIYRSPNNLEHESAKIDILSSFVRHYGEDWKVTIDYDKRFGNYNPDAYILMIHKDTGKKKDFILEYETGSRTNDAIVKEKFLKMNKVERKETRFLIVLSDDRFDPFLFPCEYDKSENAKKYIPRINTRLKDLIERVAAHPHIKFKARYLFLPYHRFLDLNQPIWQDTLNNKRNLI